jgi:GWxTD domain-containing protein
MGRIEVFIEVVYDDIQFLKTETGYDASYELSAIIMDGRDQVNGDLWKKTLSVDTFDKTNSRSDIDLSHKTFTLEPGKYVVKLGLEDLESHRTFTTEEKITIDDYSKPVVSASEITFVRRMEKDGDRVTSIFPQVTSPYKGLGHPAYAYFEIYNPQNAETAEITYQIIGENTDYKSKSSETIRLTDTITDYSITLPTDSLAHDRYTLAVEIVVDNKKAQIEKTFYMRWGGLPRTAGDLDAAIQQLQYIASRGEWKKLKKASDADKLKYFQEFWQKRDPSPSTAQNEAMESYYAKIDVANQEFSVMGREGWKSDRGVVFIILGPPNEIIRNDYPAGSRPYQIWQYYGINRQFEFYDRNGFGDFEFLYPLSIAELQRFAEQL